MLDILTTGTIINPALLVLQRPESRELHLAENSFTLTTFVSPFKANSSANWNAVSRQIWCGCHTSVDSGDLNEEPPKQSAVCSACIIPAPPANCQFIWMASACGMSAPNLSCGDSRPYCYRAASYGDSCKLWRPYSPPIVTKAPG